MIAETGREVKITKMSLAVAKDSGWYEVDYSLGENYFWGKGDGCDIFKANCSHVTVSEFCPSIFELACSDCLLYTSPSPRDLSTSRMPSSA